MTLEVIKHIRLKEATLIKLESVPHRVRVIEELKSGDVQARRAFGEPGDPFVLSEDQIREIVSKAGIESVTPIKQ